MGFMEIPLGAVKKKKKKSVSWQIAKEERQRSETSQNNASFGIAITDS